MIVKTFRPKTSLQLDPIANLYVRVPFKYNAIQHEGSRLATIMQLCAPAARAPEFEKIDTESTRFELIFHLLSSKYFMYRLGLNGPIESAKFITSFKEIDDPIKNLQAFARKNKNKIADKNDRRFFRRLISDRAIFRRGEYSVKQHPDFLKAALEDRNKYTDEILNHSDTESEEFVFKPNFTANGSGIIMI